MPQICADEQVKTLPQRHGEHGEEEQKEMPRRHQEVVKQARMVMASAVTKTGSREFN